MDVCEFSVSDVAQIADIYNHYIRTSHATFELEPLDAADMGRRIAQVQGQRHPFLVVKHNSKIVGYAYSHPYRPRAAYDRTAEISVYTKTGSERRGVATALYDRLIPTIFEAGFHTILAGIALPNDASVRLHEKFGFKKVGHLSEVGRKFDRWIDVGFWQLTINSDRL